MAKMEIPKSAKTAGVPQPAVADANKALGESIKKIGASGVDLGEGYVLVKIPKRQAASRENGDTFAFKPRQLPGVPIVSSTELRELIKRVSAADSMPKANREFLDQFTQKELQERVRLEQQGELLSSQALADQIGVTRQAIIKAVKELRMFALDGIAGQKLYPAFFADPRLDRSQLSKVSKELGQLAGASKWQFFTNPRISLNGASPITALRKGKFAEVIAAATAFKEA